jgi:hypothetical protein
VPIAAARDETLSQVLRRAFFSSTDLNCQKGAMKHAQSALPTDDILWQTDIILPSQYFGVEV